MIEGHGDDNYRYPGIQSDFSTNICLPAHHHEALMAHLAAHPELIGHYPEPEAWSLEAKIAERHGIDPRCVIVTNGATEAIYLIAQAFRYKAVIPAPTFSEYEDACSCFKAKEDKTMLWLCNPNNPDGKVYGLDYIESKMNEYDLLVLDHSYEHYTEAPLMETRRGCLEPRSIVIHSFTKTYAVPGLRLGYITAHESLTAVMRRFLRPWSVSALAVEAGKFLSEHQELICRPDLSEAQRLRQQLMAAGIEVMPTHTNFMLCRIDLYPKEEGAATPLPKQGGVGGGSPSLLKQGGSAADLKNHLASAHKMLIRDASNFRGLTSQHFRIAAQTPDENDALVAAIRTFLQ